MHFFIAIIIDIVKLSLNEHFGKGVNVSKGDLC